MSNSVTADLGSYPLASLAERRAGFGGTQSLVRDDFQLIGMFEHFFGEFSRLRQVLESKKARAVIVTREDSSSVDGELRQPDEGDPQPIPTAIAGEPRADVISACLTRLLQHYATHISRQFGSFGAAVFEDAQLVMAALADDLFIHEVEWSGRADWQRNPIEAQLLGTSNSGNTVFDRIDRLLAKRDPGMVELACINLYALRLNFQGRYRGTGQQSVLDGYRQRLFAFVTNRRPRLNEPDYRPFADAYASTADLPDAANLPHLARWVLAILAALVVYLLISHLIWSYSIADVLSIIDLKSG